MADWLRYSNQGATRNLPINRQLQDALSFLPEMGLSMEVFSGGQAGIGSGGKRTGSVRHDHGGAADVFLYQGGRRLDWRNAQDRTIFQEVVRRGKERGITGFGAGDGYMQAGSMHIGFGSPGVWGAGGKSANAPDWLLQAYNGGKTGRVAPPSAPAAGSDSYDLASIEGYIRQSAAARGIDPEIAVKVAKSEGLARNTYQSKFVKNGRQEPSYGPFQLLVGGGDTGFPVGLGNRFMKDTGLDPRDPRTVRAQIDYALNEAANVGWGQWYGAAKVGVGKFDGVRGAKSAEIDLSLLEMARGRDYAPSDVAFAQGGSPSLGDGADAGAEGYVVGANNSRVQWQDTRPADPLTNAEVRALDDDQGNQAASLWEGVKAAVDREWTNPFRSMGDYAPDRNFRLTQPLMKELTAGLPEQHWGAFEGATSQAHAYGIRSQLQQAMESERTLASLGTTGTVLRVAAGFTDPTAWAIGAGVAAASGGAGLPAFLGSRFGRLGLAAEGAMVGAAANVGSDLVRGDPLRQDGDLAWSAGAGLIFGGAFGAIARNPHTRDQAGALERIGREMRNTTRPAPDGAPSLSSSSAGAAQANPKDNLRIDTYDFLQAAADPDYAPRAFAGRFRFDSSALLKRKDNSLLRAVGNLIVEDGTRNSKGITPIAASEVQSKLHLRAVNNWYSEVKPAFQEWRKATGREGMFEERDAWTEFNELVTAGVRGADPMERLDPHVAKGVAAFRQTMGDYVEHLQNPGLMDGRTVRPVQGAQTLEKDANYAPRVFDLGSISDKLARFGNGQLTQLVSQGMLERAKAAGQALDPKKAERFAKGYIRRLHGMTAGEMLRNQRAFAGEDLEGLKRVLADSTDLSDGELDEMLGMFRQLAVDPADAAAKADKANQRGASSRLKHRLMYDENFGAMLTTQDGAAQEFVRISDLFVNDADTLLNLYSRQTSGRIAMARMQIRNPNFREGDEAGEFLVDGITSDGDFAKLKDQIVSVGEAEGVDAAQTQRGLTELDYVYDSIIGRPTFDEGSNYAQSLRMLRDFNFMRVMGQVGFAQVPELANVAAQTGLKAMFSNMPGFRAMWRNAKTGRLDDALAAETETIFGTGTDVLRSQSFSRVDEFANPLGGMGNAKWAQGYERFSHAGKQLVAKASGLAPMNVLLQRWTQRAIVNKFASLALKGEAKAGKRMQALGLDDAMLERIGKQFRDHATFEGKSLKMVNWKSWDDIEAASAFEMAGFRLARSIIQENDLGQMARWMSSPTMRTVLQFRSFMLAAWSKQFLQGMNMRDATTVVGFGASVFAASAAYSARTYLNSIGRSDQNEYLDKKLSLGALAGAGLQNSSWFTLFAPVGDMVTAPFLDEPIFGGRNTQLASNSFLGNPTVDLFDSLNAAVDAGVGAARDGKLAQSDVGAFRRLLPFQNLMGISQLYSGMVSGLPEWRPRD